MRRTILALLICVSFAGCSKAASEASGAEKLGTDTAYYNDCLGVSFTIPRAWWLNNTNKNNLSESKGEVTDYLSMDIGYGIYEGRAYSIIWLASFSNMERSSQKSHLGFNIEARSLSNVEGMADFMRYFEYSMLKPSENGEYKLIESEQITIKGRVFEIRVYLVSQDDVDFRMMTMSCEARNDFFFNVFADYWPQNTKAKQTVIDTVSKAIDFY